MCFILEAERTSAPPMNSTISLHSFIGGGKGFGSLPAAFRSVAALWWFFQISVEGRRLRHPRALIPLHKRTAAARHKGRTKDEPEVDVEEAAVGAQHQVVQVTIAHAQDVRHHAVPAPRMTSSGLARPQQA